MKGLVISFPNKSVRHERVQSKIAKSRGYTTALSDAKALENDVVITHISLNVADDNAQLFGISATLLMPIEVIRSSYLTIHIKEGSQKPITRLSLLQILTATRENGIGYPIFWDDMDFQKSEIICEDQAAFDLNEGKAFEFGVCFMKKQDAHLVG